YASARDLLAAPAVDPFAPVDPLARAAAVLVDSMAVRGQAARALAADRPEQAAALLLARASDRPLCDEDALLLLQADAFAQDTLAGSTRALLTVDGLLARRPLDVALATARQRYFEGAAAWQEL